MTREIKDLLPGGMCALVGEKGWDSWRSKWLTPFAGRTNLRSTQNDQINKLGHSAREPWEVMTLKLLSFSSSSKGSHLFFVLINGRRPGEMEQRRFFGGFGNRKNAANALRRAFWRLGQFWARFSAQAHFFLKMSLSYVFEQVVFF